MSISPAQFELRIPSIKDGASVSALISQCPPLDTNSMYCNLLQCTHFSSTSIAAIQNCDHDKSQATKELTDEKLVGFISGYIIPERSDTLFIWQVAVDETARGAGLASNMLQHILDRPHCNQITYLETTITESNQASWALFESLSKKLQTRLEKSPMFDRDQHLGSRHDSEYLARLGPF